MGTGLVDPHCKLLYQSLLLHRMGYKATNLRHTTVSNLHFEVKSRPETFTCRYHLPYAPGLLCSHQACKKGSSLLGAFEEHSSCLSIMVTARVHSTLLVTADSVVYTFVSTKLLDNPYTSGVPVLRTVNRSRHFWPCRCKTGGCST